MGWGSLEAFKRGGLMGDFIPGSDVVDILSVDHLSRGRKRGGREVSQKDKKKNHFPSVFVVVFFFKKFCKQTT